MICTCKDPLSLGVVHRADAPCYIPEQRTWVGLRDEERKFIELGIEVFGMSVEDVLKEAEAKLKEKNT